MSLTARCHDCGKSIKVKDEFAGKKVRCPNCSSIIEIPAKPDVADDDDFPMGELPAAKPARRTDDDDLSDLDDAPVAKRRVPKPVKKKSTQEKSTNKKSTGTNSKLVLRIVGWGSIAVVVIVLIASIGPIQKAMTRQMFSQRLVWKNFRHPSGAAQVEMPGLPKLDAKQSLDGAQMYSYQTRNLQTSLTTVMLPREAQIAMETIPGTTELMFNEMKKRALAQPGTKLISSSPITAGSYHGMEMKLNVQGNINMMRVYAFSNSIVCAEFVTPDESTYTSARDRFFDSLRGPGGLHIRDLPSKSQEIPTSPVGPTGGAKTLAEARKAHRTKLIRKETAAQPLPEAPPALATTVRYESPAGQLAAYLTTIPNDGKRHPAIVWISGGDCNSIDDSFFRDAPANNDQTASEFWKAGVVTMYVSLRGGNDNPGFKEGFFGEVDDVIAAADYLSKLGGIDPGRIYLGGHSTGGTLALPVAETTDRFRTVFSFGPADDIRGYGDGFTPFDTRQQNEFDVRMPAKWIDSIQTRTFVMEGTQDGNVIALQRMAAVSKNSNVRFLIGPATHFSILLPTTRLIASKILRDEGPTTNITLEESELSKLKYAQ